MSTPYYDPRAATLLTSARVLIDRGRWRDAVPMITEARVLIHRKADKHGITLPRT